MQDVIEAYTKTLFFAYFQETPSVNFQLKEKWNKTNVHEAIFFTDIFFHIVGILQ